MRTSLLTASLLAALAAAPVFSAQAQKKPAAPAEPVSLTKTYPEDDLDPLPEFQGGQEALRKFLAAHVVVPPFALANQLAAAVDVEFVLHPDGRVDSMRVTNGACCGLDEEALRVAALTGGKWTPGRLRGTPVKARVDLPITFRVANKSSRSVAYLNEMKTKFTAYQGTPEHQKDQQTYQEQVAKQKL